MNGLMLCFAGSILLALPAMSQQREANCVLDLSDIWIIVANTPAAVQLECRGGCLSVEATIERRLAYAQLLNTCPQGASGTGGNFVVDVQTGEIWSDIDRSTRVRSARLERIVAILRSKLKQRCEAASQLQK
jgi:hypothetical protein